MRVVQWATGSMGRTALRMLIDRPQFELAGVLVYSDAKDGVDAGDIVKRPHTGVLATSDREAIMALDADIVLHMPRITLPYEALVPDVERLLRSGKNVVSTAGFHWPQAHGSEYADRLRSAALEGGVTLAGVGVNPGLVVERLVLAATAMSVEIDSISVSETVDASAMTNPAFVFDLMGLGVDPRQKDIRRGPLAELYGSLFSEILHFAAAELGGRIAKITPDHRLTLAPHYIEIAAGTIAEGTVAATEWRWIASIDNGVEFTLAILWTADPSLHDEERMGHWTIAIKGRPDIAMSLDITESDPEMPPSRSLTDAVCAVAVRAIPDVVAAPPGLFAYHPPVAWQPIQGS